MRILSIVLVSAALLASPAVAAGPGAPPRPLVVLNLDSVPDKFSNAVPQGTVILRHQAGSLVVQVNGRGFHPNWDLACELRFGAYGGIAGIPLGLVTTGPQGSFTVSRTIATAEIRLYALTDPFPAYVYVYPPYAAPVGARTRARTDVVQIDMTAGTITP